MSPRTGSNWTEDSAHLACSQAATLNDEEFELDEETDTVIPKGKAAGFMKKVEEFLDKDDNMQTERFDEMTRMILEQMKTTKKKRGEKRGAEASNENAQSKPRVNSPPKL